MRRRWDRVHAGLVGWTNVPIFVLLFCESETAAARSEFDSESTALVQREIVRKKFRVFERFARSSECERNRAWNVFAIFGIELRLPIERRDLGGNLDRKGGWIKSLNAAHAAFTGNQTIPIRFAPDSERRYTTHSGDDNSARMRQRSKHAYAM